MNSFQITVLGVAVALLVIILTVVGVVLASNKKNMTFPPSSLPCPNYWQMNSDGKCVIPVAPKMPDNPDPGYKDYYTPANTGTGDFTTYNSKPLPGYDAASGTVNFANSGWGTSASSATCAKRDWAKKAGILWDGVTNYNGCP